MTDTAIPTAAPARWNDYVQLLKPRVMSLVVFTALTGLVAARAPISPILAAVAVLCIAVGAGASASLNMWYDADIDALMRRTKMRPVPAGKVQAADALGMGVVLGLFSVMLIEAVVRRRKGVANPWGEGATTLEWTLSSPPPFHQFNELPVIKADSGH